MTGKFFGLQLPQNKLRLGGGRGDRMTSVATAVFMLTTDRGF